MLKRLARKILPEAPQPQKVAQKNFEYNWDNCDPDSNGEKYFLQAYAKNWKTVIDVGANRGDYARMVLAVNSKTKVYCIEPNPSLAETLEDVSQARVFGYAVGESKKKIQININTEDDSQSSIYRRNANTKILSVDQISLDEFAKEQDLNKIDFIKIDTEGHELSVVRGMKSLIKNQAVDYIQFEYGGTYLDAGITLRQVYDLLSKNYVVCHMGPQGLFPFGYSKELETYRYSNWIAISKVL